jgi:hypothetical protein
MCPNLFVGLLDIFTMCSVFFKNIYTEKYVHVFFELLCIVLIIQA